MSVHQETMGGPSVLNQLSVTLGCYVNSYYTEYFSYVGAGFSHPIYRIILFLHPI